MILILPIHVIWGCIPEIERGCIDMTNASSTYLSIAIGAVVPQKYRVTTYHITHRLLF
jgi:hypothetical protein